MTDELKPLVQTRLPKNPSSPGAGPQKPSLHAFNHHFRLLPLVHFQLPSPKHLRASFCVQTCKSAHSIPPPATQKPLLVIKSQSNLAEDTSNWAWKKSTLKRRIFNVTSSPTPQKSAGRFFWCPDRTYTFLRRLLRELLKKLDCKALPNSLPFFSWSSYRKRPTDPLYA